MSRFSWGLYFIYQTRHSEHTTEVFGLFISLAALGLSAIDPVGIGAMPILLVQEKPLKRSFVFLGGSFVALMAMGLLFAKGLGTIVLHFEDSNARLVPGVEVIAGIVLIGFAVVLLWRIKKGDSSPELSSSMLKRLQLSSWQLFFVGALLVAVQSIIDVVFLVAMVHIGQQHMHIVTLVAAVATYALAALLLQLSVILAYVLTPRKHKNKTLLKVHQILVRYSSKALIGISFLLGSALLVIAVL